MLLNDVLLLPRQRTACITVDGDTIADITEAVDAERRHPFRIDFNGALAFPGLINSHDHLDFNCLPRLGTKKYSSYTTWGMELHAAHQNEIKAVMNIPRPLRTSWGMYKNLFAGVTSVVNHGAKPDLERPCINVIQPRQNLHSVAFEKNWKWKLNNPLQIADPCVIHAGEGIDRCARLEIDELIRFNLLRRKLIAVHGVSMTATQARNFEALVWCPMSNEFLLGRQPDISAVKQGTRLVFGTDSTLTGCWDIWQHLRMARALKVVTDEEIFSMVTEAPAHLWNLNAGSLVAAKEANIVIARPRAGLRAWEAFFSIRPEDILLVMHQGSIRLFDESLVDQLSDLHLAMYKFSRVMVNNAVKFVEGDVPALISSIKTVCPSALFPIHCNTQEAVMMANENN